MPPAHDDTCPACGLGLFASGATCPRCGDVPGRAAPAPAGGGLALDPEARYEVLETLGRGGMGVVYRVRDRELDEVIALKVLEPLFGDAASAVERFKQEIKIARRINHPNVARLYDLVAWRGRLAISMEYIDGVGLDAMLEQGPLALARVHRYLRYLCSGLREAHRLGVVHRDLKPANVRIDTQDRPHILDFGIALLAGVSSPDERASVFGTPFYMSPEQAYRPERMDHRSDIYALGVAIYRMLTGEVPFSGSDPKLVFRAHLETPPPPPSRLRPEAAPFDEVVLKCLEKEPARRYQSAWDVYLHAGRRLSEAARRHDPPGAAAPPPERRARVLIVDDDRLARRMAGDALRALGAVVIEAEDGYQGVEAALAERPDLVLLDMVMPVLDGREALRILKSNRRTADVPVVMLTGLSDADEALLSKELGAAAWLNKPVSADVLELLLEKHVPVAARSAGGV